MWQTSTIARLCNAALAVKMAQRSDTALNKTPAYQPTQQSQEQQPAGPATQQSPGAQAGGPQQPQAQQPQAQRPAGPVTYQSPVAQVHGPQQPQYLHTDAASLRQPAQTAAAPVPQLLPTNAAQDVVYIRHGGKPQRALILPPAWQTHTSDQDVSALPSDVGVYEFPRGRAPRDILHGADQGMSTALANDKEYQAYRFVNELADDPFARRREEYDKNRKMWEQLYYRGAAGNVPKWSGDPYSRPMVYSAIWPETAQPAEGYTVGEMLDAIRDYDWYEWGPFMYAYSRRDGKLVDNAETRRLAVMMAPLVALSNRHGPFTLASDDSAGASRGKELYEALATMARDLKFDNNLLSTLWAVSDARPNSDPYELIAKHGADSVLNTFLDAHTMEWDVIEGWLYPVVRVDNSEDQYELVTGRLVTGTRVSELVSTVNSVPAYYAFGMIRPHEKARDRYTRVATYLSAAAEEQIDNAISRNVLPRQLSRDLFGVPSRDTLGGKDEQRGGSWRSIIALSGDAHSYVRANKLLFAQECMWEIHKAGQLSGKDATYSVEDVVKLDKERGGGWLSKFNEEVRDVKWAYEPFMRLYLPVSGHFNIVDENGKVVKVAVDDVVDINKANAVYRKAALERTSMLNRFPANVREFIVSNPRDPNYVPVNVDTFSKKYLTNAENKDAKYRVRESDTKYFVTRSIDYFSMDPRTQAFALSKTVDDFVSFCALMPRELRIRWYVDVALASNFFWTYKDGKWIPSYPRSGINLPGEGRLSQEKADARVNELKELQDILIRRMNEAPLPVQRMMVAAAPSIVMAAYQGQLSEADQEQRENAFEAAMLITDMVLVILTSPSKMLSSLPAGLAFGYFVDPHRVVKWVSALTGEELKSDIGRAAVPAFSDPVVHNYPAFEALSRRVPYEMIRQRNYNPSMLRE